MRTTKYDLSWKAESKMLNTLPSTQSVSLDYTRLLVRQAWLKGHKAGMGRMKRIVKKWSK